MRSTKFAFACAVVAVTMTVLGLTERLMLADRDDSTAVDWIGWWFAVAAAYAGLWLIWRWMRARDLSRK